MKKIKASPNITLINFYKELLESNNIDTVIKNYYLTSGVGDLPPNEIVPELWIIDDDQYEAAKSLLKSEKRSDWKCKCGEKIEGQFEQCWNCGGLRA